MSIQVIQMQVLQGEHQRMENLEGHIYMKIIKKCGGI